MQVANDALSSLHVVFFAPDAAKAIVALVLVVVLGGALVMLTLSVDPDAFRFDDALKDFLTSILRVLLEHNRQRIENFLDGLMKLRFGRVLRIHLGH